jgi:protein TonB
VSRRVDLITVVVAVGVHAGLAAAISGGGHAREKPRVSTVELHFSKPEPPAAAPSPEAPATSRPHAAPAARPKLALHVPHPRAANPPAAAPSPPAAAPAAAPRPTPAFTVAMASTTEVSGPAVAVPAGPGGGVGAGSPGGRGTGSGAAAAGSGAGDYRPASELQVDRMPEIDTDACGRTISYPAEAEQAGVEGDVRLRIALTETGRVHAVHVLSGLGHGLDRAAVDAISHHCRFSPAIARDGKPVAFVIESYTFHFELPR